MDGFIIDALSPQEDEFALLALGVPSLYRGFFDARRLTELARWVRPEEWSNRHPEGWTDTWREFLTGVVEGMQGRLVLKSPNHTFRISALVETFPDAAYVWLVRDPAEAFFSNRKMWTSMFQRYALWNWDMSELDVFLGKAFESAASCLEHATRVLPAKRLAVVDFARLISTPVVAVRAVNDRLGISNWEMAKFAVTEAAAAKAGFRVDAYDDQTLPNGFYADFERLRSVQQAALESHGVCG